MKNEYLVTKQLIKSWAEEYHVRGASNVVLFVFWCVIGFLGLGMLGVLIVVGGDWLYWYIAILFLLISVFKLFIARFIVWSKRYKVASRTYGVPEWKRSTEFTEEDIVVTDHTTVQHVRYENVSGFSENGNVVMIYFHDDLAIRIYKDAFVEGSWEQCKQLLEQKTAK